MNIGMIPEAFRMFKRNMRVAFIGPERFAGDDEEICREIIERCYDHKKEYFRTSLYNYPEYYSRDFGMCIEALLRLGYTDKVRNTMRYAMATYVTHGRLELVISSTGKPYNFPNVYVPDGIAYFFRSLRIARMKDLIEKNSAFLNREIRRFEQTVIDPETKIVRNLAFSGMRDYAIVPGACYDMIMACMLCDEIDKINKLMGKNVLDNTLKKYDLKKGLIRNFWTGHYFKDSLASDELSSHCNIFPYWLGVITDKKMFLSSIKSIKEHGLDKPFPLKYGCESVKFIPEEMFVKDWERTTVWTFLGMPYIDLISSIDKHDARRQLARYTSLIHGNQSFVEVYTSAGKPYKSLFYYADTSMLWACMYLELKSRLYGKTKKS